MLTTAWALIAFWFLGLGRGIPFEGVLFLIAATVLFSLPFLLVSEIYRGMCKRPLPPETALLAVPAEALAFALILTYGHVRNAMTRPSARA